MLFVLRKGTSHKEFLSKISCKEALRRENIKTSLKKRTEDGDHIIIVPVMIIVMNISELSKSINLLIN